MSEFLDECEGLPNCDTCREAWVYVNGGTRGVCVLCGSAHWPWEAHPPKPQPEEEVSA